LEEDDAVDDENELGTFLVDGNCSCSITKFRTMIFEERSKDGKLNDKGRKKRGI
jgi:hypothetical protein